MSPFCRSQNGLGGLVNIAVWVGHVLVNVTEFSTAAAAAAARNTAWSQSEVDVLPSPPLSVSLSYLSFKHSSWIYTCTWRQPPSLPPFCLLHLLSALTCLRVSLLLPPPLLIQMKMYLCCMTDSSMVSAFSMLFNFKSTTHNLLAGIYVKDVTASQDQWYRMLRWKLKILISYSCCLQHAAFSEYWFFDVGHMLHLMHLTCRRQSGEHVSVLGGEVGVASGEQGYSFSSASPCNNYIETLTHRCWQAGCS